MKQAVSSRMGICAAMIVVVNALCGCAGLSVDDAHRCGDVSSADKQQATRESMAGQSVAQQKAMQQFQQQPRSNPNFDKVVGEQPLEDPLRSGRHIDENQ